MLRNRIRRIHIFSLYPDPYQKMGRIRINFIKFISSWYCILLIRIHIIFYLDSDLRFDWIRIRIK